MRAFIAGCLAAVAIAVVSGVVLDSLDHSSATSYSTSNVRLGE